MNNTTLINTIKALPFNEENFEFIKQELIKSTFPKSISEQVEDKMSGDDDSDWNYPNFYSDPNSVETDLLHKINSLETKVVDLGQSIWERVSGLESSYSVTSNKVHAFGLEITKLKKILIEEEE